MSGGSSSYSVRTQPRAWYSGMCAAWMGAMWRPGANSGGVLISHAHSVQDEAIAAPCVMIGCPGLGAGARVRAAAGCAAVPLACCLAGGAEHRAYRGPGMAPCGGGMV